MGDYHIFAENDVMEIVKLGSWFEKNLLGYYNMVNQERNKN